LYGETHIGVRKDSPGSGLCVSATGPKDMTSKILEKINLQVKETANSAKYYVGRRIPTISIKESFKVMFVAEMPTCPRKETEWDSTDNFFLTKSDLKFVKLLNKLDLDGSYITDVVKTCSLARRPTEEEVARFKDILLEEIAIIQPKTIVSLGKSASDVLESIGISNVCAWHPAYVERFDKWTEYEKQLKSLVS